MKKPATRQAFSLSSEIQQLSISVAHSRFRAHILPMVAHPPVRFNETFSEKWVSLLSPMEWRGRVDLKFVDVPLSDLEHAGSLSDPAVVEGWREILKRGSEIPPPIASVTNDGKYYLHDGNHRLQALQQYCEENESIRVAVVLPLEGYCFRRRKYKDHESYVLSPELSPRVQARIALFALTASGFSLFLSTNLPGAETHPFFVLLVIAVLFCAWYQGWMAGLAATLLNAAGAAYLLLPPVNSFWIENRTHLLQFVLSATVMLLISIYFGTDKFRMRNR